jgi:hypothetical protein
MKRKLAATIAAVVALGAIGTGVAGAAGYGPGGPGWGSGNSADCPYSTDGAPLRIHAQDGTGPNARSGAPFRLRDGTGPHGPWRAGS